MRRLALVVIVCVSDLKCVTSPVVEIGRGPEVKKFTCLCHALLEVISHSLPNTCHDRPICIKIEDT